MYQKSKALQFLKLSKSFLKKKYTTYIFEYVNPDNLIPIKKSKPKEYLNSLKNAVKSFTFSKQNLIKRSKFIDHVIFYYKFRFISYIDGTFSIEKKMKHDLKYKSISLENLYPLENLGFQISPNHFLNFAVNSYKTIHIIFKSAEIRLFLTESYLGIHIQACKTTCYVSRNKNYFVRYFEMNDSFTVYHIPTGTGFLFQGFDWKEILMNPGEDLDYEFFVQNGKLLTSCHHPKIQRMISQNKINNNNINFNEMNEICLLTLPFY